MADRQNTVVCSFDASSPRIKAFDIHEWIFAELRIPEHQILTIQVDVLKKQVFIKLRDKESVEEFLNKTGGQVGYKYPTGELYQVNITLAGLGRKRIRIANLAPEVASDIFRNTLTPYGQITEIQNEKWSKQYRYCVDNGVRVVTMHLKRHVPSHLTVAGQIILLYYKGQPSKCYGCGEVGHMIQGCQNRRRQETIKEHITTTTYASIVTSRKAEFKEHEPSNMPKQAREAETDWQDETEPTRATHGDTLLNQDVTEEHDNCTRKFERDPQLRDNISTRNEAQWADLVEEQQAMEIARPGDNNSVQSRDVGPHTYGARLKENIIGRREG
jgi:hypothetical protein